MIRNEIEAMLKPLINDLGYELWGCEYIPQKKHSLLRVYIDKEDGIGIDDCERVSKQISAFLDVEDPISGNYSLEISSPGIPRPLFYKEQYGRYLGQDIQVKLFKPINGSRKLTGTIVNVDEEVLMLKVGEEQLEIPFSHIVKANLIGE
ncbi:ribosome maturation factor RimP [Legionella micdadei]|uniref:Ribosome maturation factor RimP n=1 Tax=Legionella micdadei TaxID=451 RepID=A0A098GDS7_LEGMI|nr:ribosome maturation factor RimP [Legionella micdadei]ARG96406.1 ribosome maturation factor RimP [Legionella micdadei]ARG99155.1 ribosome maturation factor RimP [Legionella micdadei]KTD29507.1 Ribosome maturation factor RimP [Legionella micdadei]NSL18095.1 ribosome maturation factor RimP [Legionella micdadei]CEG59611.1 Ribosome maturation factor rimP [Legionella micdadei]